MKKLNLIFGILITLLVFSTCSKDDNDKELEPSVNLLIGTWKPLKEVYVCSTGSESISEYSLCEQKSRLTFTLHSNPDLETDGVFKSLSYYDNDDSDCYSHSEDVGTWSLDGDSLSVTSEGETNTPTYFKLTANTLKIGWYDDDPYDTCDGGQLHSHYYTEFVRVN